MVYVTNRQGKALMPTDRHGKVRRLLKSGLAHVVRRIPFTIQLDYDTTEVTQPITLGIDAGSKFIKLGSRKPRNLQFRGGIEPQFLL